MRRRIYCTYRSAHVHSIELSKLIVNRPDPSSQLFHQGATLSRALCRPCWESSLCSSYRTVRIIDGSFTDVRNLLVAVGRLELERAFVRRLAELAIDVVAELNLLWRDRKAHLDSKEIRKKFEVRCGWEVVGKCKQRWFASRKD